MPIMFKPVPLAAVLVAAISTSAQALPVCYMVTAEGQQIDLSHMCGAAQRESVRQGPSSVARVSTGSDVWTQNLFFTANGSTITGNIHNLGPVAAEGVIIEATGYANGRTPQIRRTSIDRLAGNDASSVSIDFGFGVPVDSWDVRIVEWD